MAYVTPDDLAARGIDVPDEYVDAWIADVEARAAMVAPCLSTPEKLAGPQHAAVVAVLTGILERKARNLSAGVTSETEQRGPFSHTVTVTQEAASRTLLWPSDVTDLQHICSQVNAGPGRAFNVDQSPVGLAANHQPWCSLAWGAYCSCGANLTRGEYPLYEGGALS